MTTFTETDTLILAQERDEVRALGFLMMLCTLSAVHGQTQAFILTERLRISVANGQYAILYERADKEAVARVPVGFICWAKLSRSAEVIYTEAFRPLTQDECKSGPNLWITDIVAPLGHGNDLVEMFGATVGKDQKRINIVRSKANGPTNRVTQLPNKGIEKG